MRLNVDETYFISVTADKIMIKDAIDKGLVSIQDWRRYARETEKDEDAEILKYENYEIVIEHDACTIRPYV